MLLLSLLLSLLLLVVVVAVAVVVVVVVAVAVVVVEVYYYQYLRSCKAPVSNGRRRRSIDQFLAGSSLEAGLLNSAPHEIMKRSPQFVRARL